MTTARLDAGALPVDEDDRLVGMITDRDIAKLGTSQSSARFGPQLGSDDGHSIALWRTRRTMTAGWLARASTS